MLVLQLCSFSLTLLISSFPLVLVFSHQQTNVFHIPCGTFLSISAPFKQKLLRSYISSSLLLPPFFFLFNIHPHWAIATVTMTFTWRNPMVSFLPSFYLTFQWTLVSVVPSFLLEAFSKLDFVRATFTWFSIYGTDFFSGSFICFSSVHLTSTCWNTSWHTPRLQLYSIYTPS